MGVCFLIKKFHFVSVGPLDDFQMFREIEGRTSKQTRIFATTILSLATFAIIGPYLLLLLCYIISGCSMTEPPLPISTKYGYWLTMINKINSQFAQRADNCFILK